MNSIKILTNSFLILLLVAGFFACSKKSDNPVAPTTPTNELKLTVGTQQITFSQGIGGYAVNENLSYVQFTTSEAGDTLIFILVFTGKQTGNQAWDVNQETGPLLYQYGTSGNLIFVPVQGSTNITAYGNVGSAISGTLTGTLADVNATNVAVSGNFTVQRSADIQTIGKAVNIGIAKHIELIAN